MAQVTLSADTIHELRRNDPSLPSDYLQYLASVGWGATDGGFMFYSAPIRPSDVCANTTFAMNEIIAILGDDMMGYCLGYDRTSRCYGEVSDTGNWSPFEPDMTLAQFLSRFDDA